MSAGESICRQCGTCCVAPDISTLGKPPGVRCRHLGDDLQCRIYGERPAVCRGYRPDGLCDLIASAELEDRVRRYLGLFGMAPAGGEYCFRENAPSRNSA